MINLSHKVDTNPSSKLHKIQSMHMVQIHHNLDLQSLFISQMNSDYNAQALPNIFQPSCNGERAALFIAKCRQGGATNKWSRSGRYGVD